jgi:TRAP-type C4-dicarboxylate transport system substrate-binding protein
MRDIAAADEFWHGSRNQRPNCPANQGNASGGIMMRMSYTGLLSAPAMLLSANLASAQTIELKIAHFVTPQHSVSQWIERWSKRMEAQSNGALSFKIFPNMQLGPPPKYYDLARTGQADITWLVHGFTPGRFPLSEVSNLPYMVGSAEIGTKMLNEPALRKFLDPEHVGVKPLLLMTHQPGNIHTAKVPIRTVEDIKGLRLRFSSATIKDFVAVLGGTPVGIPPTQIVESMQKGSLDGAFIDYGGAGTAFKMGPVTKYTTEMYSYVTSFCLCMNQAAYDRLPANLRKMIDDSFVGVEKEVGHEWDKIDDVGKNIMMKEGMTPIKLSKAEDDKFRAAGAQVIEPKLKELEQKGLPAREVYNLMKSLAAKHEKTSRTFWTQ